MASLLSVTGMKDGTPGTNVFEPSASQRLFRRRGGSRKEEAGGCGAAIGCGGAQVPGLRGKLA